MNVLYFLVPLALILAAIGVGAFVWSVRNGQFDDVETPGMRVLFDEERHGPSASEVTRHHVAQQAGSAQDGEDAEHGNQPS